MAKPVSRHILDTRAANKIMNILEGESASTKRRVIAFVTSSIDEQAAGEPQSPANDGKQVVLPLAQAAG